MLAKMRAALVALLATATAFRPMRGGAARRGLATKAGAAADATLVPREVRFGNPEYASPTITPDGGMLAYLRPLDGVMNAWVRSPAGGDDRVVTADTYRGIRQIFWAEDSKTLLYMQDFGGDENFHLRGAASARLRDRAREEIRPRRSF